MSVTHGTPTRNAIADGVAARVDASGGAGKLKIRNSSNVVLAVIILAATSHSAASGGTALLAGLPKADTDADASGTAANFIVTDFADVTIYAGSSIGVTGTLGVDLTIDNLTITIHQTVTLTSGGYTAPP